MPDPIDLDTVTEAGIYRPPSDESHAPAPAKPLVSEWARCPQCRRVKQVNSNGTLRKHTKTTVAVAYGGELCPGSGKQVRNG